VADDELAAKLTAIRDASSPQARHLLYRLDRLQRKSPDHLGLLGWGEEETDKGIADLGRLLKAAPLLLAALDAALKLADGWKGSAVSFEERAMVGVDNLAYARKLRSCSAALREAIASELTGKTADHG
jgi:hypothetical protein